MKKIGERWSTASRHVGSFALWATLARASSGPLEQDWALEFGRGLGVGFRLARTAGKNDGGTQ